MVKIDYDRGVLLRYHEGTGVEVYMYHDEPGVFLSAHGTPVAESFARQAGFEVDELMKRRRIKERMAVAMKQITDEIEIAESKAIVVKEKGGFAIVDLGYDRYQVHSPDGDNLTPSPLSRAQSELLLDSLAPDEEVPAEVAVK